MTRGKKERKKDVAHRTGAKKNYCDLVLLRYVGTECRQLTARTEEEQGVLKTG